MKNIPVRKIKNATKEPDFSGNFSIQRIGDLLADSDMVQELHRHDFFFVLVLEKGFGEHVIDFHPYKIFDHTVFFMRPGQVHELRLQEGSTGYLLQFSKDFYYPEDKISGQLLRKASNKNHCKLIQGKNNRLFSLLDDMLREYKDRQEGYQEIIKANLSIFLIELVRNRTTNEDTPAETTSYARERLDEFMELLNEHLTAHKQVSEYAGLMNLSVYRLNAITKAALGKTCSEVINGQLILESKRYLLATPNQVKEIAYVLGFEDVSYFIRFFRKHTGHSPEAFRQLFK